jgi:hypothetical protein
MGNVTNKDAGKLQWSTSDSEKIVSKVQAAVASPSNPWLSIYSMIVKRVGLELCS